MKIIDIVWLEMPEAKVFQLTVSHLQQIERALRGDVQLRHMFVNSVVSLPRDMRDMVLVALGASSQSYVRGQGYSDAVCPINFAETVEKVGRAVLDRLD